MKILLIRRDNIGDLVCTTPVFSSLRQAYPDAYIAALVNTYSAPVIANNPHLDAVFAYTKGKHASSLRDKIISAIGKLHLLWTLRTQHFDVVIAIGESAAKLARLIAPRRIISAGPTRQDDTLAISDIEPLHAVEAAHAFLAPLGVTTAPGHLELIPDTTRLDAKLLPKNTDQPLIALHLSARKPSQRWPLQRFAELTKRLHDELGASFLVFWSPGPAEHPTHPGDDDKARAFALNCQGLPIHLYPTQQLEELIAALSLCDLLVCGDGGAMHIGAGLGKPIVALFGDSPPQRWRPWQVPCRVLQDPSRHVAEITGDEVFSAVIELLKPPHSPDGSPDDQ